MGIVGFCSPIHSLADSLPVFGKSAKWVAKLQHENKTTQLNIVIADFFPISSFTFAPSFSFSRLLNFSSIVMVL